MSFDYTSIKYDLDVTHKSFFNSIADVGEKLINVDNVIEKIKDYVESFSISDMNNTNKYRKNLHFTLSGNSNRENIIERFIIANTYYKEKNNEMYYNQYSVADGGHIDLIKTNTENKIIEIIELKEEQNQKNSPLYALIEVIKNYFLLKKELDYNIEEITILAPKEYFDTYFEKNYVQDKNKLKKNFFKIIKNFENFLNVKINLKALNFSANDIINFINSKNFKNIELNREQVKILAQEFFNKIGGLKIENYQ